ncbi:MAG: ABC transporter permease [Acidobacteriota bacterium]|nr:ABC transporter permease [Acidobacteriota bacterium]
MRAGFSNVSVDLDSARLLHARFDLRNTSEESWTAADSYAVGHHLFDAETDTLVIDGERQALTQDMPRGAVAHFDLAMPIPEEPGRYRVFISLMREGVAWFYECGWEFLLIEVTVGETGEPLLGNIRVATSALLKRERGIAAVRKTFTLPVQTIWRNRSLMRSLVRRDILGRYRGSFGGSFWTILNPLLLILTYFFVFGVILRQRSESDPSRTGFLFYFLAGMLPWLAFSEAIGRAPSIMLEYRVFIKKLRFPVEILPVNLVLAGMVSETFGLALFALGFLIARGLVPASVLWLPLLVIPQFLFTAGLCWFLAALGVFIRDLGQINGFLLTIWFFMTPICYPEAAIPQGAAAIMTRNPMFVLVRGYRAIFLQGHAPAWGSIAKFWLLSVVVFLAGYAWFHKLRKSFADII